MKKLLVGLAMLIAPYVSMANEFSQVNVEVNTLGSHAGNVFYMSFKEGFATNCAWGALYCPITFDNCEYHYSMVLAAKMAGKKLSEVRYIQNEGSNSCHLTLVAIN